MKPESDYTLHEVIGYIPDTNLTPAQRRALSDWLDGEDGARIPNMRKSDQRAVINAMRECMEADEAPTTPQSHRDTLDDAIVEAFYGEPDKYPGHPDYKGEVIRTDDQMEPRGYRPGSYRDLQKRNDHLECRVVALESLLNTWRDVAKQGAKLRHEARKERDEAIRRAERAENAGAWFLRKSEQSNP